MIDCLFNIFKDVLQQRIVQCNVKTMIIYILSGLKFQKFNKIYLLVLNALWNGIIRNEGKNSRHKHFNFIK